MDDREIIGCPESTAKTKARQFEQVNTTSSSTMNMNQSRAAAKYEKEFLSAGLWLTTIIFLALTTAFAFIAFAFSFVNIWWNPVRDLFGAFGLYIWNGIAFTLCLMSMIFWLSMHFIFISKNIAIADTLRTVGHFTSADLAGLDYSFWILFVPLVCHAINIGLIFYRSYLLEQEPKAPAITVSKNDSTILVY